MEPVATRGHFFVLHELTFPKSETNIEKSETMRWREIEKVLWDILGPAISETISWNFRVAQANKFLIPLFLLQPKES